MKKSIFLFFALVAGALNLFAQDDCVKVETTFEGTAKITFVRYRHIEMPGLFSVNSGGDMIRFSQGNLQYRAATNKWRFAEYQWEAKASGNTTSTGRDVQSQWIDLFGWATSGWDNGAVAYQPWDVSKDRADYLNGKSDLTGASKEADWALHNTIINGGNEHGPQPHQWRVLTNNEWNWILTGRANASSLYGFGSLMGVQGLYLLPDGWDWSTLPAKIESRLEEKLGAGATEYMDVAISTLLSRATTYGASWVSGLSSRETDNVIGSGSTKIEAGVEDYVFWVVMEEAGLVFLPVTGARDGGAYQSGTDNYGFYWSTTAGPTGTQRAYHLQFRPADGTLVAGVRYRYYGHAVRPVQDITE